MVLAVPLPGRLSRAAPETTLEVMSFGREA